MSRTDPRVDAYIAAAAPFARPLLETLRARVHAACPDAEEAIKWNMPAFLHRGKLFASMAAFKQHASFSLWMDEADAPRAEGGGMGQFGRMRSPGELPDAARLHELIERAVALIDAGAPRGHSRDASRVLPEMPEALRSALDAHPAARAAFERFAPSHRREYMEWIAEAKRDDTRARRVAQAVEWLAAGKTRHWKYAARDA